MFGTEWHHSIVIIIIWFKGISSRVFFLFNKRCGAINSLFSATRRQCITPPAVLGRSSCLAVAFIESVIFLFRMKYTIVNFTLISLISTKDNPAARGPVEDVCVIWNEIFYR